jgi:hypothetical protein
MDQDPMPRGSLQVRDGVGEELRVVPEPPQPAVAVEAQYPAHPTGATIVIKVLRAGHPTDGTAALLGRQHLVELDRVVSLAVLVVAVVQPPWHVRIAPSGSYSPPFWT